MKLETHVHTRYSKDSLLCFWPLYLKCRLLKIDAIAITEHNNIAGGIKFKKFCDKRGGHLSVIVGEEIFTREGEIIGLYLHKKIASKMSVENTITEIKKQGGIVYIPHPYDEKRQKTVLSESAIERNSDQIDCIEVFNGRNVFPFYAEIQKNIADKYRLKPVIGSDAHTWIEVGRNYMDIKYVPNDKKEFLDVIKNAEFHKRNCIFFSHKITVLVKLIKLGLRGDLYEMCQLIFRKIKRRK